MMFDKEECSRFADLLREAVARVEAMTPEEREKMWCKQRESWVRGEMALGLDDKR